MDYQPLKKEIVFSDDIKAHPDYRGVMGVVKACGSEDFRLWLCDWLCSRVNATNAAAQDEDLALMEGLRGAMLELVSRPVQVDGRLIESCKQIFEPSPNWSAIKLLGMIVGFLRDVQTIERKICEIDASIERGDNLPAKTLTRNGEKPRNLPRRSYYGYR